MLSLARGEEGAFSIEAAERLTNTIAQIAPWAVPHPRHDLQTGPEGPTSRIEKLIATNGLVTPARRWGGSFRPAMINGRAFGLFIGFRRRRLRVHAGWTGKGQKGDDGHEGRFHVMMGFRSSWGLKVCAG